jgi:hypothetical protein
LYSEVEPLSSRSCFELEILIRVCGIWSDEDLAYVAVPKPQGLLIGHWILSYDQRFMLLTNETND